MCVKFIEELGNFPEQVVILLVRTFEEFPADTRAAVTELLHYVKRLPFGKNFALTGFQAKIDKDYH